MRKIIKILVVLGSGSIGYMIGKRGEHKSLKPSTGMDKKNVKLSSYYLVLNQWLKAKHRGRKAEDFFVENSYHKIAIYGMGELGFRLFEELEHSEKVKVAYGLDKDAENIVSDYSLNILNLEEATVDVDVVVVTASFAFDNIRNEIKNKFNCPIISLEDVIFELG